MKIVINSDFGGFSLSPAGCRKYLELKGKDAFFYGYQMTEKTYRKMTEEETQASGMFFMVFTKDFGDEFKGDLNDRDETETYHFSCRDIPRDDPDLVTVVETLGPAACGYCASLTVVEIPNGVDWQLEDYDGSEWISEKHRTWR